jgi:hypothetical protein
LNKLQAPKNQQEPLNQTIVENFYEERLDVTTIYFESYEHLNQHTQYLHKTSLIILCRGAHNPNLTVPIVTIIAARVGW